MDWIAELQRQGFPRLRITTEDGAVVLEKDCDIPDPGDAGKGIKHGSNAPYKPR